MSASRATGGDLEATATLRLRPLGQRLTANRRTLLQILEGAGQPLAMPEILQSKRGLAQSSVYRNLVVLEQAGVVHRIVTTDEYARFELAEDLTEHHHHLVCANCGAVEDFAAPADVERTVTVAVERIAKERGFEARSHRLDVIGLCRRCAAS